MWGLGAAERITAKGYGREPLIMVLHPDWVAPGIESRSNGGPKH